MPRVQLIPLPARRTRDRLVFAPPNDAHGLRGDGDLTLVCGSSGCSFTFARHAAIEDVASFVFRCPLCGVESELPATLVRSA